MNELLPHRPAVAHDCAGCPTRIAEDRIACTRCERRLPKPLRTAYRQAQRVRHIDHTPWLDALTEARAWWNTNRRDQ